MLRDAQIIGCADMPQYADMPLFPLRPYHLKQKSPKSVSDTGNPYHVASLGKESIDQFGEGC